MENWYWIELIGFDNEKSDFDVPQFINNIGEKVEGVSLLFSDVGFVVSQSLKKEEYFLRDCDCSYGGHLWSEERMRQNWTNVQLKKLVEEFHKYNIKVLFAFFNIYDKNDNFFVKHGELFDLDKNGKRQNGINVLKRFSDGSFFEDFLFEKMREVAIFYDFDGLQIADGISSGRPTIFNGDFSDDIISQFLEWLQKPCAFSPNAVTVEEYKKRRSIILTEYYYEFVSFFSDRWASFYKKLFDVLKQEERVLIFNNCWTRGPFEAKYRYGFDYMKIADKRIDAIMFEEVSATQPIFSSEDQGGFELLDDSVRDYIHYEYVLSTMRLKMAMPNTKLLALSPVKDTQEQWDVLRHAPMEMERAIHNRNCNFVFLDKFQPVIEGNIFCLCDSMKKTDWQTINAISKKSEIKEKIEGMFGFASVWSDFKLENELQYYIKTRNYTTQKLEHEFVKSGLSISTMVSCDNSEMIGMPLFVANYDFYSDEEKIMIEKTKNPVFLFGKGCPKSFQKILVCGFDIGFKNIDVNLKDLRNSLKKFNLKHCETGEDYAGAIWTAPLKYNELDLQFFKVLSKFCNEIFLQFESENELCKIKAIKYKDGKIRVLLSNDAHHYILPKINVKQKVKSAKAILKYQGYAVNCGFSEYETEKSEVKFVSRIPPRGMDIVEIECEK